MISQKLALWSPLMVSSAGTELTASLGTETVLSIEWVGEVEVWQLPGHTPQTLDIALQQLFTV